MKKANVIVFLFCFIAATLCAGGKKDSDTVAPAHNTAASETYTVKAVVPAGAPAICIAKMATDNPMLDNAAITEYEVLQAPDTLQARLISGEADIAIVPSNLSAVLYAKGTDLRFAGAVVWGVLYGLAATPINSIEDLKGQTVLTFGRGLTPDITLREILSAYGLTPDKDVIFNYVQSGQEAAAAFLSGKASFAILPEPMVSMVLTKKPEATIFLDVQAAWKEKLGGDSSYPQAAVIVRQSLIEKHPEYVKNFLIALNTSIIWAKENPQQAGEATAKIQKGIQAPLIVKGMSRMNLQFVDAKQTRPALEKYFSILQKTDPKFIGGALPQDDFYYIPEK